MMVEMGKEENIWRRTKGKGGTKKGGEGEERARVQPHLEGGRKGGRRDTPFHTHGQEE